MAERSAASELISAGAPFHRQAARSGQDRLPLGRTSGTGLGMAVLWLSLLVLLPLAAVVSKAAGAGLADFWAAVTTHERCRRSG